MAKSPIQRAFNTNPLLVRARWRWQCFLAERRSQQPVVVYQMGKVGSTAIAASLRAASSGLQVHHVHTLTQAGIDAREAIYQEIIRHSHSTYFPRARHLMVSRYLKRQLDARRGHPARYKNQRWKVITLLRDPVARNISGFFQTIDSEIPDFTQRYQREPALLEQAMTRFVDQSAQDESLAWFDEEILPALGIDVYAEPFPWAQGYAIYSTELVDLLVLRLEDLPRVGSEALDKFLKVDVPIVKANEAATKDYAEAYRAFQEGLTLPEAYVQHQYASKLAQHFYSPAELEAFREKWQTKTLTNPLSAS